MAIRWRRRMVLAKIEATYGTDPTPTAGANAIEALDATIVPLAGDTVQRNLVRPYLGAEVEIPVNTHVTLEFGVEIAGAGEAGDAPAYGPLLRACGLKETIDEGVDVQYSIAAEADPEESVTIYFFVGNILHEVVGTRGNLSAIQLEAPNLPRYTFQFTGFFKAPVEQAPGTPDFSGFVQPLPVNKANTPTFSLHGHAGVLRRLQVDLGNQIEHRDLVNFRAVRATDRRTTGQAVFELPAVSAINFVDRAAKAETGALALAHGTAAGNIVELAAPKVQVLRPSYSEDQGIAMLECDLNLVPDEGDDELVITVK